MARYRNLAKNRGTLRRSRSMNVQRFKPSRFSALHGQCKGHRRCLCKDGTDPMSPNRAHRACGGSGWLTA